MKEVRDDAICVEEPLKESNEKNASIANVSSARFMDKHAVYAIIAHHEHFTYVSETNH